MFQNLSWLVFSISSSKVVSFKPAICCEQIWSCFHISYSYLHCTRRHNVEYDFFNVIMSLRWRRYDDFTVGCWPIRNHEIITIKKMFENIQSLNAFCLNDRPLQMFTLRRAWFVAETHNPRFRVAQTRLRTWLFDSIILSFCFGWVACYCVVVYRYISVNENIILLKFLPSLHIFNFLFSSSNKRTIQSFGQQF